MRGERGEGECRHLSLSGTSSRKHGPLEHPQVEGAEEWRADAELVGCSVTAAGVPSAAPAVDMRGNAVATLTDCDCKVRPRMHWPWLHALLTLNLMVLEG